MQEPQVLAKSYAVEFHQKPFCDDYVDPSIPLADAAGTQADVGKSQQESNSGIEFAKSEI
jgi:hypothetical protein